MIKQHTSWSIVLLAILLIAAIPKTEFNYFKYRENLNRAELLAEYKKNYLEAIKAYKMAFTFGNEHLPNSIDLENLAVCYLKTGDTAQAFESLRNAIRKGIVGVADQEWLANQFDKKQWNTFLLEVPKLEQERLASIPNLKGFIELLKLESQDQFMRIDLRKILPPSNWDRVYTYVDSTNFVHFIELVKTGQADAECFLIYHLYDANEKYVPFLDSVMKSDIFTGKNDPTGYVYWYDRQRVYVDGMKTQLYGEYSDFGSNDIYPIEEVGNVDKRRAQLGLCSLRDYALRTGKKLPEGYVFGN
jgi:tetratricopeptide (TPR) repeat protein